MNGGHYKYPTNLLGESGWIELLLCHFYYFWVHAIGIYQHILPLRVGYGKWPKNRSKIAFSLICPIVLVFLRALCIRTSMVGGGRCGRREIAFSHVYLLNMGFWNFGLFSKNGFFTKTRFSQNPIYRICHNFCHGLSIRCLVGTPICRKRFCSELRVYSNPSIGILGGNFRVAEGCKTLVS